jgi:hypothetical protein
VSLVDKLNRRHFSGDILMATIQADLDVVGKRRKRSLRYCRKEDVLLAFMAVGVEVRTKCGRLSHRGITLPEACEVAGRIKEQRDLLHQIVGNLTRAELKRLLGLNRKFRRRLTMIAAAAHLNSSVMTLR